MSYKENKFSLENFKKWMKNQEPSSDQMSGHIRRPKPFVGTTVESKIDAERLAGKINPEEGVPEDLVESFLESGGTIINVDAKNFLIEVDTGSFYIHRCYVRRS